MTQTLPSIEESVGTDARRRAGERVEPDHSIQDSVDDRDRPLASIVVPYYNPGDRLRSTVDHLMRVLEASQVPFEIITVSDGSTDGSPLTLDEFPESVVRRVSYASNVGKGHALRTGLALGRGRYLGFIDADGDISPDFMASFVSIMHAEEPDIIIGSKRHSDSSVHWTPLRRLYSWVHQRLIHRLFRLDIKDTQVGIKLMDRQVVADVLPLLRESRFAFDLEFLVLARHLGYTRCRRSSGAHQGALRQHDLGEARLAPARRHPRSLCPFVAAPRIRCRQDVPIRRKRPGRSGGSCGRDHPDGSRKCPPEPGGPHVVMDVLEQVGCYTVAASRSTLGKRTAFGLRFPALRQDERKAKPSYADLSIMLDGGRKCPCAAGHSIRRSTLRVRRCPTPRSSWASLTTVLAMRADGSWTTRRHRR